MLGPPDVLDVGLQQQLPVALGVPALYQPGAEPGRAETNRLY